jgi:hypothetical protein
MLFYLREDFIKTQLNFDSLKYKAQFLSQQKLLSDMLLLKVSLIKSQDQSTDKLPLYFSSFSLLKQNFHGHPGLLSTVASSELLSALKQNGVFREIVVGGKMD